MGVHLEDHPPVRPQYQAVRSARVTGAIVLHTGESPADLTPPDTGAAEVAAFIAARADAGSCHTVVDSESTVRVGQYEWEMFHEETGGNGWSLALSFACQGSQWPVLPERWFQGALHQGAVEAGSMARWVEATVGVAVPPRRITAAEYRAGAAGFIGHADLDPGRCSDPGPGFPWGEFLGLFEQQIRPAPPAAGGVAMLYHEVMADIDELYRAYRGVGPSAFERQSWGRDLAVKMFARNEDPAPTLQYIELALRQEAGG